MRLANLLVEGTNPKVIDFDDCGFSWFLYDLATAVSFLQHKPFTGALIAAWLEGYRRVEPVPPALEAEIPTIVLLRRMAEIAWLGTRRHLAFAQSLGPAFATDSCRLAEDYLSRFG
jgi:Ser/Thr protein kinase RdoA (MazF antagonist)